ncbi:hypothetical protein KM043_013174 [Ampulex compressa]|nr:hypothetical protein KM043_013174 [Ampulex compressa]
MDRSTNPQELWESHHSQRKKDDVLTAKEGIIPAWNNEIKKKDLSVDSADGDTDSQIQDIDVKITKSANTIVPDKNVNVPKIFCINFHVVQDTTGSKKPAYVLSVSNPTINMELTLLSPNIIWFCFYKMQKQLLECYNVN